MSRAEPADLPRIRDLLAQHGLPIADLEDGGPSVHFRIARDPSGVIGVIGVQVAGRSGLLRSLAVVPTQRGRGIARSLVAEAERTALGLGLTQLVLLTETAAPFFARLGYVPIDRAQVPPEVRETQEFAALCPASATCLAKPLALSIYHNPDCGTSRNVLAILREASLQPRVIEYLKTPPDEPTLRSLLDRLGFTPRQLLREKGTPYAELGLGDESLSDERLIAAMLAHPILINRPIVVAPWGVKLCRPSDTAREFIAPG